MRGTIGFGVVVKAVVFALLANLLIFAALYGGAPMAYAYYAAWQGMCGGPDFHCLFSAVILFGLILLVSFIAALAANE